MFALSDGELGETDLVQHKIEMKEVVPFRAALRRLPYALRAELETELTRLEATGCIEQSTSPYASGLVLVRKKDGSLRVCVDYRGINKDTIPDCYPIPRIDNLIDTVGRQKGQWFTTLDLMKGYHQIRMDPDSKSKTAFTCHMGLYQYRRMPFGLINAPATFQRLMNQLFSGNIWNFVFVYLDDLLIVSRSFQEYLEHVEKVLTRLEEAGLRLKPSKCAFAQEKVEYLGHTLSASGVSPNDNKVQAVRNFPTPQCCKDVKGFLGLVNFYRRHVPNLAAVARPLTALTRKDPATGGTVQFNWSDGCERAFQELKERLATAPVLHPPDLSKPFYVWTDASLLGFGAVLEQLDDQGRRHPIAYASRQTNPAEAKYAPTQLEVAALVYSVEHFEVYLLGNEFTVYTDHQSLVSAFLVHLKSQTKGLLARWYLRLARFLPKMRLEHKPGTVNTAADALSRAPIPGGQLTGQQTIGQDNVVLHVTDNNRSGMEQVQQEQRQDPVLAKLIDYLRDGTLPEDSSEAQRVSVQGKKGYYVVDNILYYEGTDMPGRCRLVVPNHLRERILDEHHDSCFAGHFAAKKMKQRVSQYFYWDGMNAQVHKKCASCVVCASVKGQGFRGKPPLVSIPVGGIFECVGMDFVEFDLSSSGNRYALVFQDYLSKWPEVYAVTNRKAETVAQCLLDLIWKHGVPRRIIHDRAAEFLSNVLQETAQLIGIEQLPTSGGHPQTDGLVERFNRTLKQMLRKLVSKGGKDWDKKLGPVLFAYRTTPHSSSGETPFYLVNGRDPNLPSTLSFSVPQVKYPVIETEFGKELAKELKYARELARKNIQSAQREQKQHYDRGVKDVELQVGDLVMLKVEPRFRLDRVYKGPFQIKSLTSTNAVIVLKSDDNAEEMNVSRQRLSKCRREMAEATPWVGHSGRLNKRRQVRRREPKVATQQEGTVDDSPEATTTDLTHSKSSTTTTTRSGRQVRLPARFREHGKLHPGSALKKGGSCKMINDSSIQSRTELRGE